MGIQAGDTRIPMINYPGIAWSVTRDNPQQGLGAIIDVLKEKYNPIMHDEKFELIEPKDIPTLTIDARVKLDLNLSGERYGNINLQYKGAKTDKSTFENKNAQLFLVFFNIINNPELSKMERDYFIENQPSRGK